MKCIMRGMLVVVAVALAIAITPSGPVWAFDGSVACHGCTNVGPDQICDQNSSSTIWQTCHWATDEESGNTFCWGSGGMCLTYGYSDLPADQTISVAGTFVPGFANLVADQGLVRNESPRVHRRPVGLSIAGSD